MHDPEARLSDADLPAVSRRGPDEGPEPVVIGPVEASREGARRATARHRMDALLGASGLPVAAALGLVATLGLASLLGERVRSAVLVEVETTPPGPLSFHDAPEEAARFFALRDTVTVRVPRDMTVSDFLALYHLETNAGARAALREQLGAAAADDPLREGDRVRLPLTLSRPREP